MSSLLSMTVPLYLAMVLPDRGGSYANQRFFPVVETSETPLLCQAKHPLFLYELLGS